MAPRVIDDFEFVWMLRGEARVVTEHEEWLLLPARLLLVPPAVLHSFAWDERRASRHGYVHFDPGPVAGTAARRIQVRPMTDHDPLAGLCAHLLWLGRDRPQGWERDATQNLRFLLTLFTGGRLPQEDTSTPLRAPLSAVVDHLRREWSEMPLRRVDLDELAYAARVSRSYLNRRFKAEFGVSVASGLERLRCSRAEALLARTDMTIGSIAYECGFADLFHFSHRFTRLHGISPSVYRDAGSSVPSAIDDPGVRRLANALWE